MFYTGVFLPDTLTSVALVFFPAASYGMLLGISIIANVPMFVDLTAFLSLPIIVFFLMYQKRARPRQNRSVRNFSLGLTLSYFA